MKAIFDYGGMTKFHNATRVMNFHHWEELFKLGDIIA
jgi:hypothetical protein